METTYSIFNAQGENVEPELFSLRGWAELALIDRDYSEYGVCHVGINCPIHDELEVDTCPHCHKA